MFHSKEALPVIGEIVGNKTMNVEDALKKYNSTYETDVFGRMKDLEVMPTGKLVFKGEEYNTTSIFLETLSNMMMYPLKVYMSRLGADRHADNLNALLSFYGDSPICIRFFNQNARGLYRSSKNVDGIRIPPTNKQFIETLLNSDQFKMEDSENSILETPRSLKVTLTTSHNTGFKNDPSRVNLYSDSFYSGPTTGVDIGVRLKRFSCDNSTIVKFGSGYIRGTNSPERTLDAVKERLPNFLSLASELKPTYERMITHKLDVEKFKDLRDIVRGRVGTKTELSLLPSYYKTDVAEKIVIDKTKVSSKTAYDLFNDLTWNAKVLGYDYEKEAGIQTAAGDVFRSFFLN